MLECQRHVILVGVHALSANVMLIKADSKLARMSGVQAVAQLTCDVVMVRLLLSGCLAG